jgi:hypothetical protein
LRKLLCFLLFLTLQLQALASQETITTKAFVNDAAHEIDHLHGTSHHHDDNGTVHYDDSAESSAHLIDLECCQQTADLPSGLAAPEVFFHQQNVSHFNDSAIPDGYLECPHRPPSSHH